MRVIELELVKRLAASSDTVLATARCRSDVQELGLTSKDVETIIGELQEKDWQKSHAVCGSDFGDVAADQYCIWIDDEHLSRCARDQGTKYYLKLGLHASSDSELLLVVRFHLAKY